MGVGIDGCRAGWIGVSLMGEEWKARIFPSISELWVEFRPRVAFIDIPIGLLEENGLRQCDFAARELLGKRAATVFPVPCRQAVYQEGYEQANKVNREITGKGISKQTWNICSKIREVDAFLVDNLEAQNVFKEAHPELCFAILNRRKAMEHSKKTQEGLDERLEVLASHFANTSQIVSALEKNYRRSQLHLDDILDALCLAINAQIGDYRTIPRQPQWDPRGLRMQMVTANLQDS